MGFTVLGFPNSNCRLRIWGHFGFRVPNCRFRVFYVWRFLGEVGVCFVQFLSTRRPTGTVSGFLGVQGLGL